MQRAIIALLKSSPLPWTFGMLADWFDLGGGRTVQQAVSGGRLWQIERGLYTAGERRCNVVRMVTDEMIERYTGLKL